MDSTPSSTPQLDSRGIPMSSYSVKAWVRGDGLLKPRYFWIPIYIALALCFSALEPSTQGMTPFEHGAWDMWTFMIQTAIALKVFGTWDRGYVAKKRP